MQILQDADKILFIPDALNYMLTGKKVTEYTIASTSGLLNPDTRDWDNVLFESISVDKEMWAPIVKPGTVIGNITDELPKNFRYSLYLS